MRNLWAIMTKFNVLPSNEDFRKLTDAQIDLILYSMEEDYREMERASKGIQVDSEHYDSSFEDEVWNRDVGDWEVLKEGHDPDEIARQVEALTRAEDLKNLSTRFDGLEEYSDYLAAGGKTVRETEVEQYINRQLALAEEKARRLSINDGKVVESDTEIAGERDSLPELDKEAIARSIALFNQQQDDEDDEYTML